MLPLSTEYFAICRSQIDTLQLSLLVTQLLAVYRYCSRDILLARVEQIGANLCCYDQYVQSVPSIAAAFISSSAYFLQTIMYSSTF